MPFTASHAAAVLPFGRRLSASALVIGAMLPDLPFYTPLPMGDTHTLAAMVSVNLVAGLALFVIWHGFLARPLDWFAPSAIRRRLSPSQQPGLRRRLNSPARVVGVFASLLLGQATHLFFDQFTHADTLVTGRFTVFEASVLGMPFYYFLQVVLSVAGLVLIAAWTLRWYRTSATYPLDREPSRLGKLAARGTVVGGSALAMVLTAQATAGAGANTLVVHSAIAAVAAAGVGALLVATVWHVNNSVT